MSMRSKPNDTVAGEVIALTDGYVYGWALPQKGKPAVIQITVHDVTLATGIADIELPKELGTSPTARHHGFVIFAGRVIHDAQEALCVRIANTDHLLPINAPCQKETVDGRKPQLTGFCENHESLRVWGWILPSRPARYSTIYALEDGNLIGSTVAQGKSAEALRLGIGPQALAFELTLPTTLADGKPHSIQLMDEERRLFGRALRVHLPPLGYDRWLNDLSIGPDQRRLIETMLSQSRQWVPKTLGFSSFGDWYAAFFDQNQANDKSLPALSYNEKTLVSDISTDKNQPWVLLHHESHRPLVENLTNLANDIPNAHQRLCYFDTITLNNGIKTPRLHARWDPLYALSKPDLFEVFAVRPHALANYPKVHVVDLPWIIAAEATNQETPELLHYATFASIKEKATPICPTKATWEGFAKRLPNVVKATIPPGLDTQRGSTRITWRSPKQTLAVTIVIPTRDHFEEISACIASIKGTKYADFEILVIDNQTSESRAKAFLKSLPNQGISVVKWDKPFNYAAMHNDVIPHVKTPLVCLLNNDIMAEDPTWLTHMTQQLTHDVGAVGAKLVWPNGMVQHAGVILGRSGLADHIGTGWSKDDAGFEALNGITRRVSAVTAACLLMRTEDYRALGGFRAHDFPICFNDVDLCLRIQKELNKSIVFCSDAVLVHKESASRGLDESPAARMRLAREIAKLREHWGSVLFNDLFYSRHLGLDGPSHCGLALPPRDMLAH